MPRFSEKQERRIPLASIMIEVGMQTTLVKDVARMLEANNYDIVDSRFGGSPLVAESQELAVKSFLAVGVKLGKKVADQARKNPEDEEDADDENERAEDDQDEDEDEEEDDGDGEDGDAEEEDEED